MNGLEFIRELRNEPEFRSIAVFVMTTPINDNEKIEAYKLNEAVQILKPITIEKFVNSISILNNYWKLFEEPETSTL